MSTTLAFAEFCAGRVRAEEDELFNSSSSQKFEFSSVCRLLENGELELPLSIPYACPRTFNSVKVIIRCQEDFELKKGHIISKNDEQFVARFQHVKGFFHEQHLEGIYILHQVTDIEDLIAEASDVVLCNGVQKIIGKYDIERYDVKTALALLEPHLGLAMENSLPNIRELTFRHSLKGEQERVIETCLTQRITLIEGQPGTGKTETIVELVRSLVELGQERVFVVSESERSVNNVCARLIDTLEKMYGIKDFPVFCFAGDSSSSEGAESIPDLYKFSSRCFSAGGSDDFYEKLSRAQVLFTTIRHLQSAYIGEFQNTTIIVEDSSSIPLYFLPVIISRLGARACFFGDSREGDVKAQHPDNNISCMKYLIARGHQPITLKDQHRMIAPIANMINKVFYGGQLLPQQSANSQYFTTEENFPHYDSARPTIFYHETSEENDGKRIATKTSYNTRQTEMCLSVLEAVQQGLNPKRTILVICAYEEQLHQIVAQRGGRFPNTKFTTIEGSKSREADVVVFVTSRSNLYDYIADLDDPQKINMALSRSKGANIIIGDLATLHSYPLWSAIIDDIENNGKMVAGESYETATDITCEQAINFRKSLVVCIRGLPFRCTKNELKEKLREQLGLDVSIAEMRSYPEYDTPHPCFLGGLSGDFLVRVSNYRSYELINKCDGATIKHLRTTRLIDVPRNYRTLTRAVGRVVILRGFHRYNEPLEQERKWVQALLSGFPMLAYRDFKDMGERFCVAAIFPTEDIAEQVVDYNFTYVYRDGHQGTFMAWISTCPEIIDDMVRRISK